MRQRVASYVESMIFDQVIVVPNYSSLLRVVSICGIVTRSLTVLPGFSFLARSYVVSNDLSIT
ncbi:hypothetical protein PPE03_27560 [Pseudoalteromonas peptidolytica]|nr:hypothetical protein PPE03_27560 [Pseudoalteromonas peptidolytica]